MAENLAAQVLSRWAETAVGFCPGLQESEIDVWEAAHGVRLPAELRALYRATNGMEYRPDEMKYGTDAHLFRFWPLEEVDSLESLGSRPPGLSGWDQWYVFADTFIDAYFVAVALGGTDDWGRVVWGGGDWHVDLAKTFPGFLDLYLRDPDAVIDGVEPTPLA